MKGVRIAVFGIARSGIAIAKAALANGAIPVLVDEKSEEALSKTAAFQSAKKLEVEIKAGWKGDFLPSWADEVVTSPGAFDSPHLKRSHERGIPVLSEIEFAYRISKAPIVAITGTNGKSTTTAMTYDCLRAAGAQAVLCGNIAGSGYQEQPLTEAALNSTPDQILVAEISSFQLEWTSKFRPIAAAITNITPDHLDRHKTFDEYVGAKLRIFAAQTADDYAVVNADDPEIEIPIELIEKGDPKERPSVLRFGRNGDYAEVTDEDLILVGQRVARAQLSVFGEHNVMNSAAAALLAAAALQHPARDHFEMPGAVVDGLRAFKGIVHRMELVGEKNGVRVINNSMCTNPAAVVASSRSIPARQHLLVGGSNKKLDFGPVLKYMIATGNKHRLYLFGRDAKEVNTSLGGENPVFETMAEAFQAAIRNAKAGEVVMLAPGCASMDQFRDFEDRGNVFKTIAKEWLES